MFSFWKKDAPPEKEPDAGPETKQDPPADAGAPKPGWRERLKQGLARTRDFLNRDLTELFSGERIDERFYEELETTLLAGDVGIAATEYLIERLRAEARRNNFQEPKELRGALREALLELLQPIAQPLDVSSHRPFIMMITGVNGSGKTTSIGKIAKYYQSQGKSVLLAAGDTFRAAAREQLQIWGERNNITVIAQQSGDAAAVIFDAIGAARARGVDILLADTAGRLPTQLNLMEEIKKVKRVIAKAEPGAPHEILLVLDANTGQNTINQVKAFDDALGVTGLVLTKLDGTAKGGAIAAMARQKPIPLRFIGVGEGLDDLRPFDAEEFVEALLG
jgi:fused signal recognition particle receptor